MSSLDMHLQRLAERTTKLEETLAHLEKCHDKLGVAVTNMMDIIDIITAENEVVSGTEASENGG